MLDILCTSAVNDTVLKTIIHRLSVTCFQCIGVQKSKKNLPPSRSDLRLVSFLLWRALQQKLYRQNYRDIDHLKCVLLHCWIR